MTESFVRDILPVLTFLIGVLATYIRTRKKDSRDEGEMKGVILSDIGYIKAGIDDLKKQNEDNRKKLDDHEVRITRTEEGLKALKEEVHNA
ncbi:MAG: hypothetical protein J6V24_04300 [Clostridia bacterium]|nr:hypothetical protein [Clostridia bacterium]